MKLQESGEMYLETIYVLSLQNNVVRSIDVGNYMGYSKPSVSRAIGILKKGGYVLMDEADGHLSLTDAGTEVATRTYERHQILSKFFIDIGVDKETATEDACKIEHDISCQTFDALKNHIQSYKHEK